MKKITFKNLSQKAIVLVACLIYSNIFSQSWQAEGPILGNNLTISTEQHYLAIDSNNHNYILMRKQTQNQNYVVKYDGSTWAILGPYISEGTTPDESTGVRLQSIAIDDNDTVYVAYIDNSLTNKVTVKKWDGNNWVYVASSNGIGTNTTGISNLTLKTYNNDLYLSFHTPGIGISVGKFDGSTWSLVGNLNISNAANYVDLGIDNTGMLYLAYQDITTTIPTTTVKKYDGTDWVLVGAANISFSATQQKLAFKIDNTPCLVYAQSGTGSPKLEMLQYNGTSWLDYGNLASSLISNEDLSFVIDNNDIPYIAYTDNSSFNKGKILTLDIGSNSWGFLSSTNDPTSTPVRYNNLALDNSNVLHYAYEDINFSNAQCLVYNATLSIDDNEINILSLHPNPAIDSFKIYSEKVIKNISIYNIQGKLVKTFNNSQAQYNIESLTTGLYFIHLTSDLGTVTKKLIIK